MSLLPRTSVHWRTGVLYSVLRLTLALAKTGSDQLRRLTRVRLRFRIGTGTLALYSRLSVLITSGTEGRGEGVGFQAAYTTSQEGRRVCRIN